MIAVVRPIRQGEPRSYFSKNLVVADHWMESCRTTPGIGLADIEHLQEVGQQFAGDLGAA
jgi:hypothetical protein